ncbi:hypothetical protein EDB85DRAFT_2027144, partial [Lactarius pseudohatsudake]
MGLGLELTSRDHSATSTFMHARRLYRGPGLPLTGELPPGINTFLFSLPLPPSSPPSIDFGNRLTRIRYGVGASVGVAWKYQNLVVTSQCPVDFLQRYPGDDLSSKTMVYTPGSRQNTWSSASGKILAGPRPWRYAGPLHFI